MSDLTNAKALVQMYRGKNVAVVQTPSGPRFFGMRNIPAAERKNLLNIAPATLNAVLRWQS